MLITILVAILILALVLYGISLVPLDSNIRMILQLVCVVVAIIFIARAAGLA